MPGLKRAVMAGCTRERGEDARPLEIALGWKRLVTQ